MINLRMGCVDKGYGERDERASASFDDFEVKVVFVD